jgi:hypothetical protein
MHHAEMGFKKPSVIGDFFSNLSMEHDPFIIILVYDNHDELP